MFVVFSLSSPKCVEILKHLIMSNIKTKHILAKAEVVLVCVLRKGGLSEAVLSLFSGEAFDME